MNYKSFCLFARILVIGEKVERIVVKTLRKLLHDKSRYTENFDNKIMRFVLWREAKI